jgi:hypothetical protein
MPLVADLHRHIEAFHAKCRTNPHHRYRSWEHCYRFFNSRSRKRLEADKDAAALHLGFYLASWGMYRGSSFLLQHAYTVHVPVVELLVSAEFAQLWKREVGVDPADGALIDSLLALVREVKHAYRPFCEERQRRAGDLGVTDTLATKVILGTVGCLPACDRYFVDGFRLSGRSYARVNRPFVQSIIRFCNEHLAHLRREQARIEGEDGVRYPLMKLADMYFWQIGSEADAAQRMEP